MRAANSVAKKPNEKKAEKAAEPSCRKMKINGFFSFATRFFSDEYFATIFHLMRFFFFRYFLLLHYVINVIDKFYWNAPFWCAPHTYTHSIRIYSKFFLCSFVRLWRTDWHSFTLILLRFSDALSSLNAALIWWRHATGVPSANTVHIHCVRCLFASLKLCLHLCTKIGKTRAKKCTRIKCTATCWRVFFLAVLVM